MSLNDKYRPKSLDMVIGQDDICDMIKGELAAYSLGVNAVSQSMLFVGPAGTGKTTVARILANNLHTEIFELDAASNCGVDNVRQIQEEAFKRSVLAKGKCFILDECVTGDTEILTSTGFKRFDCLDGTEEVAQYDKGNIEFVHPSKYIKHQYCGELYKWNTHYNHSVRMTPHHVQPLFYKKRNAVVEKYIDDVNFNQNNYIITSGMGTGNNDKLSALDRLAIALQADGSLQNECNQFNYWIIQVTKERKKERLYQLLIDSGVKFSEVSAKDGCVRYSCRTPKNITKKLSTYFNLNVGYDRAKEFISEIILWDGSGTIENAYYSCVDKSNVDFVSAVATLGGYSCSQTVEKDNRSGSYSDVHRLKMYNKTLKNCQYTNKTTEYFNGDVYCVVVPSHQIIVRSEGYTFMTGNCHSFSNQAWQAFLKIIEEPPKDVYFIFCTTESQKIPETILSRVRRFDFNRVSDIDITIALNHICAYEGLSDINISGLEVIAEHSHGCVRQAITYLDKILSSGGLKDDIIYSVLGINYGEFVEKFVNSMTAVDNKEANKTEALEIVTILNLKGINYKTFFNACFSYTIEQAKKTTYEVKDKYLSLLEWIITIREHLMNEDMPLEYIESMILLR